MTKKPPPPTVADLLGALNDIAPPRLAESWDNVGLQVGHHDRPAGRVLVALEVTPALVAEAKRVGAATIVAHHPLIFAPLKSLAETNPVASLVADLVRAGISMISVHTNLDMVADGTNGEMADRLGLVERDFLLPNAPEADSVKYAVFVPATHVDAVIEACAGAGAGVIGNYSHCSFRTPGTGTYKPLQGANPFAGTVGKLEQADGEVRLEVLCPKRRLAALLKAVRAVHPYEEIAYDVYTLEPTGTSQFGLGIVGKLETETTLGEFASACKKAFGVNSVGIVGDDARRVKRVAVCSGAGGEAVRRWRGGTADVLVTGEMTHHQCAEARDRGAAVVLVGHHASEVVVCARLADRLRNHPCLLPKSIDVVVAQDDASPLRRA